MQDLRLFNLVFESDPGWILNRPGFPGECFICELRLPDHRFRWKHNKLFLLLPEEYGPAFPAIVDC
ncbi:MchC protein, partial [Escherichia coli]|nr:MchC protein [Escherichia coli]